MKMKHLQICVFVLLWLSIPSVWAAGLTPDHLSRVQQKLTNLGYDPGPVDGILGPKTTGAVKQYQLRNKLPVTGKLDDGTLAALGLPPTAATESQRQTEVDRETKAEPPSTERTERRQPEKSLLLSIPFSWYFGAGIILSLIAFFIVKRTARAGRKKGWSYFFARNSLEFLIPFIAVCAFYSVMAFCLTTFSTYLDLKTLIRFESVLSKLKSLVDALNFEPLTVLVIIILIFTFGLLGVASQRLETAAGAFGRYQKITRRIYTVIVLLCSFTLLGTYAGVPTNDLHVRIKTLRDGYADLVENTENIITAAAADEILKNARDRFPKDYTSALATSLVLDEKVSELDKYYRAQKEKWKIDIASANRIIQNNRPKSKVIIIRADSSPTERLDKKAHFRRRTPLWASSKKIEGFENRIKASGRGVKPYLIEFLKNEHGRKIACEIPKVFTGKIRNSIVRQVAAGCPILEPLADVVVNSFDDKIQQNIEDAALRITDSGLKQPANAPDMLDAEVKKLTAAQNPSIKNSDIEKARALGRQTRAEYEEIEKTRTYIESQIKSAQSTQIRTLISQLKSPSPEIRAQASRKLSQLGSVISKEDYGKIVDIMHHGKDETRKKLYRQSHCTWYEYTQSRYHAAETLLAMKSPHANDRIVADAKKAKATGRSKRRVTDPGWV
jgi:hypothetical protein